MTFSCNFVLTQSYINFLQLPVDKPNNKATQNVFQAAVSLAE